MMTRVAIISLYIGQFPKYFDIFKHTAFHNKDYDWFIFTDQVTEQVKENNINFIPYTLPKLNEDLSGLFGTNIKISTYNKICDAKPIFGKLFESYIAGYDWWGWTDLDLLNGNFNNFLSDTILNEYDAVGAFTTSPTSGKKLFHGPFMLFSTKLKNLYQKIPDCANMLNTDNPEGRYGCYYVDELYFYEALIKNGYKLYSSKKMHGYDIGLIRYGKRKLPAIWNNGNIEIQSYHQDYDRSYFDKFGCDTMILHLPKNYNNIIMHNESLIEIN
jgi:hypothetical protein